MDKKSRLANSWVQDQDEKQAALEEEIEQLWTAGKLPREDDPHTAASYHNLAGSLHHLGKYAEAEPLFRRALAICEKVLGEEHPRYGHGLWRPGYQPRRPGQARRGRASLSTGACYLPERAR
jgi:hypothetical protein